MALSLEALEEVRAVLWIVRDGLVSSHTLVTIDGDVTRPVYFKKENVPNLLERLRLRIQDLSSEIERLEHERAEAARPRQQSGFCLCGNDPEHCTCPEE